MRIWAIFLALGLALANKEEDLSKNDLPGKESCDKCHHTLTSCQRFPFRSEYDRWEIQTWAECMKSAFDTWKKATETLYWPDSTVLVEGPVGGFWYDRAQCFDYYASNGHCVQCAVSHEEATGELAIASNDCWVEIDKKVAAGESPGQPGHPQQQATPPGFEPSQKSDPSPSKDSEIKTEEKDDKKVEATEEVKEEAAPKEAEKETKEEKTEEKKEETPKEEELKEKEIKKEPITEEAGAPIVLDVPAPIAPIVEAVEKMVEDAAAKVLEDIEKEIAE